MLIVSPNISIALLIGSGTIDFTNSRLVAEDAIVLLIGSGEIDFTNFRLVAEGVRMLGSQSFLTNTSASSPCPWQ